MLELPKVNKRVHRALTRLEKTQKVIAGVALAMGVALAGVPSTDAQAATGPSVQQPAGGSLLLTPPVQAQGPIADHYSHSSHGSHGSHHSHYSSRY